MHTVLWGGPLDGCELEVSEPVRPEMVVPQLTGYPPSHAEDEPILIRHHYVFDITVRRYNYAGDWP